MWRQHVARTCVELWFGGGKGINLADTISPELQEKTCAKTASTVLLRQGAKNNNNLPVQRQGQLTPQS